MCNVYKVEDNVADALLKRLVLYDSFYLLYKNKNPRVTSFPQYFYSQVYALHLPSHMDLCVKYINVLFKQRLCDQLNVAHSFVM